jgi:hypothetical protein
MLNRVVMALGLWLGTACPCIAQTADLAEAAIRRGVDALYRTQNDQGHWEVVPARNENASDWTVEGPQWGGRTALATYALLASGEKHTDPRVARAIDFLRRADINGYYALGMRAQVWTFLPPTSDNVNAARRDLRLMKAGMKNTPGRLDYGLFDYTLNPRERIDLSVSQYGVLAFWALDSIQGVGVPTEPVNYWAIFDRAWLRHQDQVTGGWSYDGTPDGAGRGFSASMTSAGVATLFITQDYTRAADGVRCQGNLRHDAIDKGIRRLVELWPSVISPEGVPYRFYTLYGYERVGVASGLKFLGSRNWFAEGVDFLARSQLEDGLWGEGVVDTSFALLFLSRGREPVALNKVRYSQTERDGALVEANWNQRPRDIANVARFLGRVSERTLNWQIIDLEHASPRDLHDAPILYFAGSSPIVLTDNQKQKIKSYVQRGGMLLFNPDCNNATFQRSVARLLAELFPEYELRVLPESHPLLSNQQFVAKAWRVKPRLQGLSNGVRELAVVLEDDYARTWQVNDLNRREHLELAAAIHQYAIDKDGLQYKGRSHYVEPDPALSPQKSVRIARLRWSGNWDPEPGGWQQLAARMLNDNRTSLRVESVDPLADSLEGFPIAHLTGTGTIPRSPELARELASFVRAGGTLLIDAAGGDSAFATSIEVILKDAFAGDASQLDEPLASDLPVLNDTSGPAKPIAFRAFARARLGNALDAHRLRGITIDNRLAVIYSREDLSAGLVGQPVDGILGYSPETATEIVRRLVMRERASVGTDE